MIKRCIAAIIVMLMFGIAIILLGKQPKPMPEGSDSAAVLASHAYAFTRQDIKLVDNTRPTQANNDVVGTDMRTLETSYWYPVNDLGELPKGEHPLVVYSHGFGSTRNSGKHIAEYLASNGYIVFAPDFPLTNRNTAGGPKLKDVVNQPGDVSFLIDTVVEWSLDKEHVLYGHVDHNRIGAAGISLGGMTTTLVSYHPTERDSRIKAAASIAGPTASFSEKFYRNADIPFLMLASNIDALVPYNEHALPVLDRVPRFSLVTIDGGSHLGFAAYSGILRWLDNADAIGCYSLMKNIDTKQAPWHHLLGTPEQGILYGPVPLPCQTTPLPVAINPLRQHQLTQLAVFSFFESHFNSSIKKRRYFNDFLHTVLPKEIAEVTVDH